MNNISTKDKRQSPRVDVNRSGRMRVADGPESIAQLIEISETGAMVFYSTPVSVGTDIELRFSLRAGAPVPCQVYGDVKHYSARGASHVLGVRFTYYAPGTVEAIREYIDGKLRPSG